jgi:hypothetical protein
MLVVGTEARLALAVRTWALAPFFGKGSGLHGGDGGDPVQQGSAGRFDGFGRRCHSRNIV